MSNLLNNIHKRGLSKKHTVKVKGFPGATTFYNFLPSKPDMLIVHEGTNDLPNNLNPLNNLRKVSRSEMLDYHLKLNLFSLI